MSQKRKRRFKTKQIPKKYIEWRRRVLRRDQNKCQMPGCFCNSRSRLQVHHILTWAKHRGQRYNTDNGITLCKRAHKAITGKEDLFIEFFQMIVQMNKRNETKTSSRT